jgi:6-phosphofructokinase 1
MNGRTLLVGQSGGATAVINATLAGVIESARATEAFDRILGLRHGTDGLLMGEFIDLTDHPVTNLRETPSSALGTTRRKTTDEDRAQMLDRIRELGATALVLIGGNDSADTAHKLGVSATEAGLDLSIALAPKTVDNDLLFTDHCPGYASAARVLANIVRDATFDTLSSPDLYPIKLIEVMGRDAGWLAASTALGFSDDERDLQPLIFFPEARPESAESAIAEIMERVHQQGWCVAVVPETLKTADGEHLSGADPIVVDPHGHPYHPSAAEALCRSLHERGIARARYERPGSFVRASSLLASPVDRQEAYDLGWSAAARVAAKQTDIMVTLDRISDEPYQCAIGAAPLGEIANQARPVPDGFIAPGNRGISDSFRAWAGPLLGPDPFPAYARLDSTARAESRPHQGEEV